MRKILIIAACALVLVLGVFIIRDRYFKTEPLKPGHYIHADDIEKLAKKDKFDTDGDGETDVIIYSDDTGVLRADVRFDGKKEKGKFQTWATVDAGGTKFADGRVQGLGKITKIVRTPTTVTVYTTKTHFGVKGLQEDQATERKGVYHVVE